MKFAFADLQVECMDAWQFGPQMGGWELKPHAIQWCPFQQVLLLDADNIPVQDPEFLFRGTEFTRTGAMFWPDIGRIPANSRIWSMLGLTPWDEKTFESGQVLIDKTMCGAELEAVCWLNAHSYAIYPHIHGDKDTFYLAWTAFNREYTLAPPLSAMPAYFIQKDLNGNPLFQHRHGAKWNYSGPNWELPGFQLYKECLIALSNLRKVWNGSMASGKLGPPGPQLAERPPIPA